MFLMMQKTLVKFKHCNDVPLNFELRDLVSVASSATSSQKPWSRGDLTSYGQ